MSLGGYKSVTYSTFNTGSERIFNGSNGKERWFELRSIEFYD
jgi:hypothetical protein